MATREHMNKQKLVQAVGPAVLAATTNGNIIDTLGFDSATVETSIGAGGITFNGSNYITQTILKSDDGTNFVPVVQADILASFGTTVTVDGSGTVRTVNTAHASADAQPTKVAYIGSARYIKAPVNFFGTHGTGTPVSTVVSLSNAHFAPVA